MALFPDFFRENKNKAQLFPEKIFWQTNWKKLGIQSVKTGEKLIFAVENVINLL